MFARCFIYVSHNGIQSAKFIPRGFKKYIHTKLPYLNKSKRILNYNTKIAEVYYHSRFAECSEGQRPEEIYQAKNSNRVPVMCTAHKFFILNNPKKLSLKNKHSDAFSY